MNVRQISNVVATWAGLVAAVATAYGFLHTYRESSAKQIDERNKQTFDLLRHFSSRDFMPIREKALLVVRAAQKCDRDPIGAAKIADSEAFAFVEFFDLIQACLDAQLCDEKLARQFFLPYATAHWVGFRSHIAAIRKDEERLKPERPYGYGLERLARIEIGTKEVSAFAGCTTR
jgi:hypothetical protein